MSLLSLDLIEDRGAGMLAQEGVRLLNDRRLAAPPAEAEVGSAADGRRRSPTTRSGTAQSIRQAFGFA